MTAGTFLEIVCPAVGCPGQHLQKPELATTFHRQGGKTGCSLWVIQLPQVVGCCAGAQALTASGCFAVNPVDMLVVDVANIQIKVWERPDGRRLSRERGGL